MIYIFFINHLGQLWCQPITPLTALLQMTGTLPGKVGWQRQAGIPWPSAWVEWQYSKLSRLSMGAAAVLCSIANPAISLKSNLDLNRAGEACGELTKAYSPASLPNREPCAHSCWAKYLGSQTGCARSSGFPTGHLLCSPWRTLAPFLFLSETDKFK